jgi:predicted dehydrogenase
MTRSIGVVMNGVTGRMGYRQHLIRSVLAIREQGGVPLASGERVILEPYLVGRSEDRLERIAREHGISRWTTELDRALAADDTSIYFDAQVTSAREEAILRAMEAGLDIYTEKPLAESAAGARRLADAARRLGRKTGVVHDKLYLPGLLKLRRVIDSGFLGRVLSVRGEFGYWVFEGDWQPAQRPSWNYRAEDGGGITVDMYPHWSYVLENLLGPVRSVYALAITHIPQRWDEGGKPYEATADDAAYGILELGGGIVAQINSSWCTRVNRGELVEFHVDGTLGSAVAGLHHCRTQPRVNTPAAVWNPDLADPNDYRSMWEEVPGGDFGNAFKAQWEAFIRHVCGEEDHPYDFAVGVRGLELAEAALLSSREGRRVELKQVP